MNPDKNADRLLGGAFLFVLLTSMVVVSLPLALFELTIGVWLVVKGVADRAPVTELFRQPDSGAGEPLKAA